MITALRQSDVKLVKRFPPVSSFSGTISRAIRTGQWPKNLLVFLPIFLGHRALQFRSWESGILAGVIFCLAASVSYLVNDLLDLEADRQHLRKCTRPLANGDLSIPLAFLLIGSLGASGFALSLFLPVAARLWIVTYFACTLCYSLYLKTRLLADVIALASLYALRVIAGGAATGIVISPWTIAFCLFLFFSLALVKRYGELRSLPEETRNLRRRGYRKEDLSIVAAIGASSGVLSVVVFALYISSADVYANYRSPALLWLVCPVLLYWFGRIWILVARGDVAEDPVLYSLHDRISYVAGACIGGIWLAASVHLK